MGTEHPLWFDQHI